MAKAPVIRTMFDPSAPNGVVAVPAGGAYGAGDQVRRAVAQSVGSVQSRVMRALPLVGAVAAPAVAAIGDQRGRVALRDFVDGLSANPKGGVKVPVKTPAPAKAATPVEQAMAVGRAAEPTITPYDRQLAFLDTVFRGPLTMREASAYTQMLPQRNIKPPTAKDTVLGETAKLSQAIYQNQIDQATKLAETDPEGARAVTEKATSEYFGRQAGLVGFNPVNLAQSLLMSGAEEEE